MAVFSLVAERSDAIGKAIRVDIVRINPAEGAGLTPNNITVVGQDDKEVKQSARRGAWIAYQELIRRKVIGSRSASACSGVAFDFAGNTAHQISGSSAGLCFLIRMTQLFIEDRLQTTGNRVPQHHLAATGILASVGSDKVRAVEAINAKIDAALELNVMVEEGGYVFYPKANDPLDATLCRKAVQRKISLVAVDTPEQVITFLLKLHGLSKKPILKWWRQFIIGFIRGGRGGRGGRGFFSIKGSTDTRTDRSVSQPLFEFRDHHA